MNIFDNDIVYNKLRHNNFNNYNTENTSIEIAILIFYYSFGCISVIFSLFLVFIYLFYKSFRTWSFELVVYLCIFLIITNISYMIYFINPNDQLPELSNMKHICYAQGILITIGELGQFLTTTFISYSIFFNVVKFSEIRKEVDKEENKKYFRKIVIFTVIVIPLFVSFLFYFLNMYGKSNYWCWLANDSYYNIQNSNKKYSLSSYSNYSKDYYHYYYYLTQNPLIKSNYISLAVIIYYSFIWLLMLSSYMFLIMTIKELIKLEEEEVVEVYIKKLIQFPIILLFIVFPHTLSKFLITLNVNIPILNIISVFLMSIQGIIYTVSYGFNESVKYKIKELLCCKKKRTVYPRQTYINEVNDSNIFYSKDYYLDKQRITISNNKYDTPFYSKTNIGENNKDSNKIKETNYKNNNNSNIYENKNLDRNSRERLSGYSYDDVFDSNQDIS